MENEITVSYAYDGTGTRIGKTVNGVSTGQIWNNGNVIAEYGTKGTKMYIRGAGGEIVKTKDSASNSRYFSYNAHGDTTNIIEKNAESTSFAVTAAYEYDAFGGLVSGTGGGEADSNGFRYNGQYTDEETGLIYLLNRYYDPSIGGFTQEDPYWNPTNMIYGDQQFEDGEVKIPDYHAIVQSANLYVYCANDPVNGIDPTGLELNYVATFIAEYDAKIYVDNDNRCTWVTMNGTTQPIYWDSENNWYFDSTKLNMGENTYVLMDRTDFLKLFDVDFVAVEKDYNPDVNSADLYNVATILAGFLNTILKLEFPSAGYDNYINQQYKATINGESYVTEVWVKVSGDYSVNSWTNKAWDSGQTRDNLEYKEYYLQQGYYSIY